MEDCLPPKSSGLWRPFSHFCDCFAEHLREHWRNIKFSLPELMVSFVFVCNFYYVDAGNPESHLQLHFWMSVSVNQSDDVKGIIDI